MRAFTSLNTFMTDPSQIPFLKMETLDTSTKAPPPPLPQSGACCTAEGTSGHRKEHFRRKASLPAQRAERKPLGAQKTGDICHRCQPCRRFAAGFAAVLLEETGCPRRGPVDGDASPKLERCPSESAGETGSEEPRNSSPVPDLPPASAWRDAIQTIAGGA